MDRITIYLQGVARRRKISGFPNSIDWFIAQQRLTADFGPSGYNAGQTLLKRKPSSDSNGLYHSRKKRRS